MVEATFIGSDPDIDELVVVVSEFFALMEQLSSDVAVAAVIVVTLVEVEEVVSEVLYE